VSDAWPSQQPTWTPPPQPPHPPTDALISADLSGWFARYRTALRNGWRQLAAVQAVYLAAFGILAALAFSPVYTAFTDLMRAAEAGREPAAELNALLAVFAWVFAGAMLLSLVQLVVSLATLHITATAALGTPAGVGAALLIGLRRLPMMIGWGLLSIPMVLVGLLLCYLPGLYLLAVLVTLPAIVLYERGAGIGRCFALFHHDFSAALSRVATLMGIYLVASMVSSIPAYVISFSQGLAAGPNAQPVIPGAGMLIGMAVSLLVPMLVSGLVIQPLSLFTYADLRARYEPFTAADLFRS
jgi:hypothetical protein